MSYGQKTVLTLEKFYKNRHNWGSRPSPGMILVGKLIILSRGIFLKPQNSLGRPGDPKNDRRKKSKNAKIGQNLGGRGPLVTLKGPLGDHSTGPGGFFHLHPLIGA